MKIAFTPEELNTYFAKEYKPAFAEEATKSSSEVKIHADGTYPEVLLGERRPHEHPEVQEYRKKIFVSKTKGYFGKILTSLNKIRRSADWSIKYSESDFPRIPEGETLEDYCTEYFPIMKRFEHWVFKVLLRAYLIDPNAVVFWLPTEIVIEQNAFVKPAPYIFPCEKVIAYEDGDWCILLEEGVATYTEGGSERTGDAYYVITSQNVFTYWQINGKREFTLHGNYPHALGLLPAYKIGASVVNVNRATVLYESRIAACIPHWNEAVREYSDLQAAVVLHIFPERWEYAQADCKTCMGAGRIAGTTGTVTCPTCGGVGRAPSPYQQLVVTANEAGTEAPPTPPAGYIVKDVEIVKLQDTRVAGHIYEGLSAVNMEFLMKTPLTESGIAKEVDRDELNTFVYSVAEDLVDCMEKSYKIISYYRYLGLYPADEVDEMLPDINVPTKFDMLSANYLEQEVSTAKTAGMNQSLVGHLEVSYASKKFPDDPDISAKINAMLQLDPLYGVSESDKSTRYNSGAVSELNYIVSSNIQSYLQRAIEADPSFYTLPYQQQMDVLYGFASEQQVEKQEKEAEKAEKETATMLAKAGLNGGSTFTRKPAFGAPAAK